jgi:N-formylglutamate amidohydrolase
MSGKARPKKASKLKAYIKNKYHEEDALVDEIFDGLAAAGLFVLDGTKVKYQDS